MQFVIFGAGLWGARFYVEFNKSYDIACFCDNDPEKQGKDYLGMPVIAPEEIKERGLSVIIPSKKHFEMAQQLFELGIKEFHLLNPENKWKVTYIDLTPFDSLSTNPNRIYVCKDSGVGSNEYALVKYNPYDDIELVLGSDDIDTHNYDIYKDGTNYYAYFASRLIISQQLRHLKGKKCIELWHGFTVKALWNATFSDYEKEMFSCVADKFCHIDAICSYSRLYNIFFGYCAGVEQDKFRITGMPRNDLLLLSDAEANIKKVFGGFPQKNIIFYLPTHRDYYDKEIDGSSINGHAFFWSDFDIDDFNIFLRENDILFIVKFHFYELERFKAKESENIRNLNDDMLIANDLALYEILGAADLLLTDYSSVSVDYLLLDSPIVFAIRDIDEYSTTRGLMTEPFDAWAAGETVQDYASLKNAIHKALFDDDKFKEKRDMMRRIMHKYDDAQSTKRVLDLAREILRSGGSDGK